MLDNKPLVKLVQLRMLGSLLTAAGGLFCMAAQVIAIHWNQWDKVHGFAKILLATAVVILPVVPGIVLDQLARRKIVAGLKSKTWPQNEIEGAQRWLDSPSVEQAVRRGGWLIWPIWGAWFLYCTGTFASTSHHHPSVAYSMFLIWPYNTLAAVRTQLRNELPVAVRAVGFTGKRLFSESWGMQQEEG